MAGHKCMVVCLMCFDLRLFSKFHFHGLGLYMHKAMSRLYKITIFYNWSTLYIRTRTRKYMYLYPIKLCNIHMYALTRMNMSTWLCVRCFFWKLKRYKRITQKVMSINSDFSFVFSTAIGIVQKHTDMNGKNRLNFELRWCKALLNQWNSQNFIVTLLSI